MEKPTYFDAVQNLTDNKVRYGRSDGPIDKIILIDGIVVPTEDSIQTELTKLIAEYDAQEYARKREAEYPTIGDQMDMIYKDMKNETTTHAEAVEEVKTKYPKG